MGIENYKRGILNGLGKMKNNNIEEQAVSENTALNIVDSKEIVSFDYSSVDEETASFLQQKEAKITQIRMMSVMAIGKELKDSFDKLSKLPYGSKTELFNNWVESIGISSRHARRYIDAFDYVQKNFPNIEDAEKIQPSLLFAISKPSAPKELQDAAIAGDITTHKHYKELEEKLRAAENEALEAKAKAETERNAWQRINESYNRLEKTNHEHYEKAKKLEEELEKAKEQLLEAQSSGDNIEVERLRRLLNDTESELEDSKNKIEELESELNDSTEVATAVVEIEKVPDEVLEELEGLREENLSMETIEINAEVKALLKVLNSNIISLGRILANAKENSIAVESKFWLKKVKENMKLLKNISIENLKTDLFDFNKD